MTQQVDPPLLETEGGPLADALADARDDVLDQRALADVARTLPFMTGAGAAAAPAAAKGIATWKIVVLSAIVAALGVGGYWLATRPPAAPAAVTTARTEVIDPPATPVEEPLVAREAVPAPLEQQARRQKRTTPVVRHAPPSPATPASPAPPEPSVRTELELVRAAHAAIGSSPQQALALVAEHARLYPNGALSEEREAIRIEALVRTGRTDEARQLADAFHRRHPQSVHWRRISAVVNPGGP